MPKNYKHDKSQTASGPLRREYFRNFGDTLLGEKYIYKVATKNKLRNKELWCLKLTYSGICIQWYYRTKEEAISERKRLINAIVQDNTIENVKPINNVRPPYIKYDFSKKSCK